MSLFHADLPYIVSGVSACILTAALPSLIAANICNAIIIAMKVEEEEEKNDYSLTAFIFSSLGLVGGIAMFLQVFESDIIILLYYIIISNNEHSDNHHF